MQHYDERADTACALALKNLTNPVIQHVFSFLVWLPPRYKKLDTYNARRVALLLAAGLPNAAVSRVIDFMHPWEKHCPRFDYSQI